LNLSATQIKDAARDLGFEVAGITSVEPLETDDGRFEEWKSAGFAADMTYMLRSPAINAYPGRISPRALSLISLAVDYYAEAPGFNHEGRYGKVARYAWGLDYHEVVKPRLFELINRIEKIAMRKVAARAFVDAVPLLERAAGARAGLGFFGKNTNLLQPRGGSWFFLAEMLLDIELPGAEKQIKINCGSCHRCLDACPTNAFAGPFRLDSRRCISYLTIENKGPIPRELRSGIGEWIFGCDVCQDVCPFNRFAKETKWPELLPKSGVGPRLDLVETLSIATDEEFRKRFRGTALTRPKRRGLLRNAAVVAANVGATAAVPALIERIEHDSEALIRGHAIWALSKLDRRNSRAHVERAFKNDPDLFVRDEATRVLLEHE
jgi:epoxyqueuosine reductase